MEFIYIWIIKFKFNKQSNLPGDVKNENISNHKELVFWCKQNSTEKLCFSPCLAADLPQKHTGAGLARKIGMDTAIQHFIEAENPNGIIISLDADTQVHEKYFTEIEKAFSPLNQPGGCILNFSHVFNKEVGQDEINAAKLYEIHLRYYRHALLWSGYPYSHYTIGSCFAVKASVYCKYGGMNRRKAGEDFYFLLKIFPNEHFEFIREVLVYPSPRISKRVPFGTGPVIEKIITEQSYKTYHPLCFRNLKRFIDVFNKLDFSTNADTIFSSNDLPEDMVNFLNDNNFRDHFKEIQRNSATIETFRKRFFNWFNGLLVIQYFNYSSMNYYPKTEVLEAVKDLFDMGNLLNDKDEILGYLLENDFKN